MLDVLAPFAFTRGILIAAAWIGFHLFSFPLNSLKWEVASDGMTQRIVGRLSASNYPLINMWSRWDAGWYLGVAKDGYQFCPDKQSNVVFFPAYPYLVRFFHSVVPFSSDASWLAVGIILSNTALIVALTYLYLLVRLEHDEPSAKRAVIYLCIFPMTLFLSAVYSESVFLAFSTAAFYYARRRRWACAGVLAAAAILCRPPGVLIVLPLSFEYFSQKEFKWSRVRFDCLPLLLAPLSLAAYLGLLRWRFGAWDVLWKAESVPGWNHVFTLPWSTLLRSLQGIHLSLQYHGVFELLFAAILVVLSISCCFKLRACYAIYAIASTFWTLSWGNLRSVPRYAMAVFPVIIVLALLGRNRLFHWLYLPLAATVAVVSMIVFSQWGWVS